jgi:hypothetical protein
MGIYNFQERFVPMIQDGTKTHTIRAPRKGAEDVPGNTMHLYTGLRRKGAKLLARFECVRVDEIVIGTVLAPRPYIVIEGAGFAYRPSTGGTRKMKNIHEVTLIGRYVICTVGGACVGWILADITRLWRITNTPKRRCGACGNHYRLNGVCRKCAVEICDRCPGVMIRSDADYGYCAKCAATAGRTKEEEETRAARAALRSEHGEN